MAETSNTQLSSSGTSTSLAQLPEISQRTSISNTVVSEDGKKEDLTSDAVSGKVEVDESKYLTGSKEASTFVDCADINIS